MGCLSGSQELKQLVLPSIASGEAMISYALSERDAGSDAAAMRTRAVADGDGWVLNGTKCWITNAGVSSWYTVMAVTDPGKKSKGISAFVVHVDFTAWPRQLAELLAGRERSPCVRHVGDSCRCGCIEPEEPTMRGLNRLHGLGRSRGLGNRLSGLRG